MVTPDIHNIIKKSLEVGKNLMFYLPRLIDINELFELIHEVNQKDIVYLDIHILESANKIKAILFMFGPNVAQISKFEMENFINMITKENNLTDLKEEDLNSEGKEHEGIENDYKEVTTITRKNSIDLKSENANLIGNSSPLQSLNSLKSSQEIKVEEKEDKKEEQTIKEKEGEMENLNQSHTPPYEEFTITSTNPFNELTSKIKKSDSIDLGRKFSEKETESMRTLLKIHSVIGVKKFFEGMVKYKEKYEAEDLKKKFKLYTPKGGKTNDLLNFFMNEILTEKQISRLNI